MELTITEIIGFISVGFVGGMMFFHSILFPICVKRAQQYIMSINEEETDGS